MTHWEIVDLAKRKDTKEQAIAVFADNDIEAYDGDALQAKFVVIGFAAPYVVVQRKSDDKKGTLQFFHSPRVYFDFVEDLEDLV